MASAKPQASNLRLLILAPAISEPIESVGNGQLPSASTKSLFSTFLENLTGSAPSSDLTSFAGYTSHPLLSLRTRYYAAEVNLWCDELPFLSTSTGNNASDELDEWKRQMLSAEAQEIETNMRYVAAANEVRDQLEDESGRDIATVVVVQDTTPSAAAERNHGQSRDATIASFIEKFEDSCVSDHGIFGWDIIFWQPRTRQDPSSATGASGPNDSTVPEVESSRLVAETNEYGEKLGMARVIEVLQQTDWLSSTLGGEEHEAGYDLVSTEDFLDADDEYLTAPGFKPNIRAGSSSSKDPIMAQSDEFQREIMGLHFALEEQSHGETGDAEDKEDIQVEQLSGLMERVVAIKEAASEMSGVDREAFARREVSRIMREMNVD